MHFRVYNSLSLIHRNIMVQVNPAKVRRCFGEEYCSRFQSPSVSQVTRKKQAEIGTFLLGACLAYFSALNLEAICFCEKSANLLRITGCHILEDNTSYYLTTTDIRTANPTHGSSPRPFSLVRNMLLLFTVRGC